MMNSIMVNQRAVPKIGSEKAQCGVCGEELARTRVDFDWYHSSTGNEEHTYREATSGETMNWLNGYVGGNQYVETNDGLMVIVPKG